MNPGRGVPLGMSEGALQNLCISAVSREFSQIASGKTTRRQTDSNPRNTVPDQPFKLTRVLARWMEPWRTPRILAAVTVCFSDRLSRSLGRGCPEAGHIRLSLMHKVVPLKFLVEVLCHEAPIMCLNRTCLPH